MAKAPRYPGLGLLVGAVLHGTAWVALSPPAVRAQVVLPPASEVPLPKPSAADTARARSDTVPRDTIKAAIGRLRAPETADIGPQYRWTREELFASGAFTLADLLLRVPELTVFRSGWIASPQTVAHSGSFERVRLILDGVEVDALDLRTRGLHDLSVIQIWMLEELVLERAAGEVRIHMRSWGVTRTTPYTRADVATGTEETDLYRAFYGKRFGRGEALQLAAQQYGTTSPGFGNGGDALSLFGRVGVGRPRWSLDAAASRTHFSRDPQQAIDAGGIPTYDASHTLAYLRASIGARVSGPYLELLAASHQVKESSPPTRGANAASLRFPADSADTTTSRTQFVATAGFNRWGASIAITDRLRQYAGEKFNSLSGRADFGTRFGSVGVFAENDDERGVRLAEVQGKVTLASFLSMSGAASTLKADRDRASVPSSKSMRGEIGVRLFGPWLYGGVVTTDTIATRAPRLYDTSYAAAFGGRRTGSYVGLRGRGWRGLGADAYATRWKSGQGYVPETQARGELSFISRWLSRFPRGDFAVQIWAAHEYRSRVLFPSSTNPEFAVASHVASALLEIRIMRAVLSYQVRNIFGFQHTLVPGFAMPRELQIYGVRWEFWN